MLPVPLDSEMLHGLRRFSDRFAGTQAALKALQYVPLAWGCLAVREAEKMSAAQQQLRGVEKHARDRGSGLDQADREGDQRHGGRHQDTSRLERRAVLHSREVSPAETCVIHVAASRLLVSTSALTLSPCLLVVGGFAVARTARLDE